MEAQDEIPSCRKRIAGFCGPKNYIYKYGDNGSTKLDMKLKSVVQIYVFQIKCY